ncbi:MAG: acyl-CoA dehydrogenase family protein [Aquisalimonadaceae bacterium]
MNINYTAEEQAFRAEVRGFLETKLPSDIARKVRTGERLTRDDVVRWQRILNDQGWFAVHWPREYGGTGWDAVRRYIFEEESAAASAPPVVPFGVNMVAPVLIRFGTEAQKHYYLPRILNQEDWWCQGYSEPGAGSDLASLSTRAVRDGDHYVVNGQKTWTTLAHYANRMFCLVRTDPDARKQQGISFLLIDMDTPGITVRPIITLDGEHDVNEVFFDDVRVPVANRVGEENQGWDCAKYLLTYERTGIAGVGYAKAAFSRLKKIASTVIKNGRPLIQDHTFRIRLAQLEMELLALEMTNLRLIASVADGGVPGAESSILKIRGTEVRQAITDLMRQAAGPYALPHKPVNPGLDADGDEAAILRTLAAQYFNFRKLSIYGGSNEIQKNIIAKRILGL